jgi:hypothetical protein
MGQLGGNLHNTNAEEDAERHLLAKWQSKSPEYCHRENDSHKILHDDKGYAAQVDQGFLGTNIVYTFDMRSFPVKINLPPESVKRTTTEQHRNHDGDVGGSDKGDGGSQQAAEYWCDYLVGYSAIE